MYEAVTDDSVIPPAMAERMVVSEYAMGTTW